MIHGIEIRPYHDVFPTRFPQIIMYTTHLVPQPRNTNGYIPLEKLISREKVGLLTEEQIGMIKFDVEDFVQGSGLTLTLIEDEYCPFTAGHTQSVKKNRYLMGKGIADRIDLWIAEHLMAHVDVESPVYFDRGSKSGRNQLKRRGIGNRRQYRLIQYYQILREIVDKQSPKPPFSN